MIIDNDIIESHFDCNYKSYLKLAGHQGKKHVFEKYQISELRNDKKRFLRKILKNSNCSSKVTFGLLKKGQSHIANVDIQYKNLKLHCDLLKRVASKSTVGNFAYIPILVIPSEKITKKFTTLITGLVYVLSKIQGIDIGYGEVFYAPKFKTSKVSTNKYLSHFHAVIDNILQKEGGNFRLNSHCIVCEFSELCREKAIKEDHLSLLKGMAPDTIKKLNNRGIFTTNQLSYTFRPKRKSKIKIRSSARSFALQALAIREKKIFVYDIPAPLPKGQTEMFFDIEGLPDDNLQYLIGLTIKTENKIDHINFWSNTPEDELSKASEFLATVLSYENFVIYHYGSYETDFLKKLGRKLPEIYQEGINKILSHSINVLSILYSNIYFPTYSNGLKEIGKFIGFKRSETITGLESIVLRRKWEVSNQRSIKERLFIYNREDCLGLLALKEVLSAIIENNSVEAHQLEVCNVKDLQKYGKPSFIVNNSFLPEMKFINDCSYFDYQREKVHAKSNTAIKKIKLRQQVKKSVYTFKPNKIISVTAQLCEKCKSRKLLIKAHFSRKITDLKFTIAGVRRCVIQYISGRYLCKKCKHLFIPKDYPIGRLHVGHNLISWTMFENIVNRQGFRKIESSFKELFHLNISSSTFHACKDYFVRYYESTYQILVTRIIKSSVLYVDETPFSMQFENGYVWVFTNGEDVISFYKPTRESSFLKDF
jgi:predicted RecB family nuclease